MTAQPDAPLHASRFSIDVGEAVLDDLRARIAIAGGRGWQVGAVADQGGVGKAGERIA